MLKSILWLINPVINSKIFCSIDTGKERKCRVEGLNGPASAQSRRGNSASSISQFMIDLVLVVLRYLIELPCRFCCTSGILRPSTLHHSTTLAGLQPGSGCYARIIRFELCMLARAMEITRTTLCFVKEMRNLWIRSLVNGKWD